MRRIAKSVTRTSWLWSHQPRFAVAPRWTISKDDPFGEKRSWDTDLVLGDWADIDIDQLNKALDDPNVKATHFGLESVRGRVQLAHAIHKVSSKGKKEDSKSEEGKEKGGDADAPASWKADPLMTAEQENLPPPSTYEEFALRNLARAQESEEMGAEDEDEMEEEESWEDGTPLEVPPSLRAAPESAVSPDPAPAAATSAAAADLSPTPAPSDIPNRDPATWNTEEVIAWLRKFGELDESVADAFRMVRVDGEMLLTKVAPPELFKQMRRWHLNRTEYKPQLSELLIQETVYLCYPYCK
jgi:hypothetical protein